ncbi:MAG TPA: PD-(D/E)XK nuclease family protein, partial [Methylibium sp.]
LPDSEAARLGRAVHRVLEWAVRRPPGRRAAELDACVAAVGAEFRLQAAQKGSVRALSEAVLAGAEVRRFLDPRQSAWSGNEVPLSWRGEQIRLDRLVAFDTETGREWWVLDYKLQHAPEQLAGYRAQLENYRRAVQAAQPGERVRAAFITGAGRLVEL